MYKAVLIFIAHRFTVILGDNLLNPLVDIPSLGTLEGTIGLSVNNATFYSFESVPYAEPPVGSLRFEKPKPVKPWKGIRQAQNLTLCLQYSPFDLDEELNYLVVGHEDCLFVNIYTHSLDSASNLDVIVHIHGGAFIFGYGGEWGPRILMDREQVVYVSLNYRLGPLGFLSTEDNVIPGNNGLRDQTLALKWIKENIKYFGGNPNSITLWGFSAGGASVHYHYMMPQSKGLFAQGFSHSGCAINSWALVEYSLSKAKRLADYVGCSTTSSVKIKKCLKLKKGEDIVGGVKLFQPWLFNPFSPFGVVVDSWADEPLLKNHPYNLLKSGEILDLPWIVSHTTSEGLYPAAGFYDKDINLEQLNNNWNDIIPFVLHYNETIDLDLRNNVSQQIREFYMKDSTVNRANYSQFVEILTDRLFVADIGKAARLHSAAVKSDVYSYVFSYRGNSSISDLGNKSGENLGVGHGDDVIYIANHVGTNTQSTEEDRLMSNTLVELLFSYAKNGKPNIRQWLPLSKKSEEPFIQLNIASPSEIVLERKDEIGHRSFWDSLPFKENEYFKEGKRRIFAVNYRRKFMPNRRYPFNTMH